MARLSISAALSLREKKINAFRSLIYCRRPRIPVVHAGSAISTAFAGGVLSAMFAEQRELQALCVCALGLSALKVRGEGHRSGF